MVGRDDLKEVAVAEPAQLVARALERKWTCEALQIKGVRKNHRHDLKLGHGLSHR